MAPSKQTVKKFKQLFAAHQAQWPIGGPLKSAQFNPVTGQVVPGTSPQAQRVQGMMALFDKLKQRAGIKGQILQQNRPDAYVADEHYMPAAWASPGTGQVTINTAARPYDLQNYGAPYADPQTQHLAAQYDAFTTAHELGHLAEPQLVRNKTGADQYLDATLGSKGRIPYWMMKNMQGRTETRMVGPDVLIGRDKWGMPTKGPGTTHSAPNEQYATDFAGALGYGQGSSMKPSKKKTIAKLQKMGRLPK